MAETNMPPMKTPVHTLPRGESDLLAVISGCPG